MKDIVELQRIIARLDSNGDDVVSRAEVVTTQKVIAELKTSADASKMDVNLDGKVDMKDVVALQQKIQKFDVNSDGVLSKEDVATMQRIIASLE